MKLPFWSNKSPPYIVLSQYAAESRNDHKIHKFTRSSLIITFFAINISLVNALAFFFLGRWSTTSESPASIIKRTPQLHKHQTTLLAKGLLAFSTFRDQNLELLSLFCRQSVQRIRRPMEHHYPSYRHHVFLARAGNPHPLYYLCVPPTALREFNPAWILLGIQLRPVGQQVGCGSH